MKFAATITALAAFAATALAQIQVASPPNLITCQPNQVSWTGGTGPFFVSILPGGQSGGTPLVDLGEQQSSPYVWNVNVAAGQSVTIRVSDQEGNIQYSSPIPVIAGSSTSCVGQAISGTSAGSTVPVASSAASSAASAAASSAAASTTGSAASSAASSASSAAASSVVSSASASASSAAAATTSAPATTSRASTGTAASSTVAPASSSSAANAAATQAIGGAGAVLIGAIGAVAALF